MRRRYYKPFTSAGQGHERAVIYTEGERVAGAIIGSTFRKFVFGSRHFLSKPRAVCYDRDVLHRLVEEGVRDLLVIDRDDGHSYRIQLARFMACAFPVRRGGGDQLGCVLSQWRRDDDPVPSQTDRATQRPLFGQRAVR